MLFLYILIFTRQILYVDSEKYRLSEAVIPIKYNLITKVYMQPEFKFTGVITIKISVLRSCQKLTLHAKNLKIHSVNISKGPKVQKIVSQVKCDFLHIFLRSPLQMTTYDVQIIYSGEIIEAMTGFYRSKYYINGEEKWLASTHFESISAREVFPCFDEPALKALFKIRIIHEAKFTAISNMPLTSKPTVISDGKWVQSDFEESIKMSTYLVAFVVSEFKYKTVYKNDEYSNVTINVWARENAIDQLDLALNITPKIIHFFEKYFNYAYPLPKMDLIGIPNFAMGAMENWGLITYRERFLLYNTNDPDKYAVSSVVVVVTHEIAHQWFGNLVTMKWWNELWLKEGFASYLEVFCKAALFGELSKEEDVFERLNTVFQSDNMKSVRPISQETINPNSILELYDSITYEKGSVILKMMNSFVGDENFHAALVQYIHKYKYSSTVQDELFALFALPTQQDFTVKRVMDSWIKQAGYPLITASVSNVGGQQNITFKQKRFLINPRKQDDSIYYVPITLYRENDTEFIKQPFVWLTNKEITFKWNINENFWYILNVEGLGLYRTNYNIENWELLIKQLNKNPNQIPFINRMLLYNDIIDLAIIGEINFDLAFQFIETVKISTNYIIWSIVFSKLKKIENYLLNHPSQKMLQQYIQNLYANQYDKIWKKYLNNCKLEKYEQEIFKTSCFYGEVSCVNKMREMFIKWLNNPKPNEQSISSEVLCIGIKESSEKEWNLIYQKYLNSNDLHKKIYILEALSCSKNENILKSFLDKIRTKDSGVKPQDADILFKNIIYNSEIGHNITLDFFYKYVEDIYENQSPKGSTMGSYLKSLSYKILNHEKFNELKKFIQNNMKYFSSVKLALKTLEEEIEANILIRDRISSEIMQILTNIQRKVYV